MGNSGFVPRGPGLSVGKFGAESWDNFGGKWGPRAGKSGRGPGDGVGSYQRVPRLPGSQRVAHDCRAELATDIRRGSCRNMPMPLAPTGKTSDPDNSPLRHFSQDSLQLFTGNGTEI